MRTLIQTTNYKDSIKYLYLLNCDKMDLYCEVTKFQANKTIQYKTIYFADIDESKKFDTLKDMLTFYGLMK